jgi:hypothetical protein
MMIHHSLLELEIVIASNDGKVGVCFGFAYGCVPIQRLKNKGNMP